VSRRRLLVVLAAALLAGCQNPEASATPETQALALPAEAPRNAPEHSDSPYVLLISIDGYRHDYTEIYQPENLARFADEGVRATSLIPSFPSDTFPNHYGIVTGMFPGTHGIVANNFFDPARNAMYQLGNAQTVTDGAWYGGTPLWSAAEAAGMVSASYFWVGSEAEIASHRPSYAEAYASSVAHSERIARVLDWLRYPVENRPHFITLYFSSVDTAGHSYGPESEEVRNAVLDIDRDLGTLFEGLETIDPPVNVFIVSDHGMVAPEPDGLIDIDAHADLTGLRAVNLGSKIFLYGDDAERIDSAFSELRANEENYRTFLTTESPDAWHADNPRFGDIVVAADSAYTLLRANMDLELPRGAHGYDAYLFPEMRGIFYARGPDLAQGVTIPSFSNVHIYPLVVELLGLDAAEGVDGRLEVLQEILR
jgi:predicted AlkP superfamily pyrophosphatase or phosphodiesterase